MADQPALTYLGMTRPVINPFGSDTVKECETSDRAPLEFDPIEHLRFIPPARILTMADISLPDDTGISPTAVSEPFPLFSTEAIVEMRREVFSDGTWMNCGYSSNIAACQLRGMAPKYASFVYNAWKHPRTLAILSQIAGIELVPSMDYEIGHINVSVKKPRNAAEGPPPPESTKPIVDWHTDSYPFVCVLMMSDTTTMVGGETALRTGTGEVIKVHGPQMGSAVVLQGRYIKHQALAAFGADERITMVTSFRPRSAFVADDTTLSNVRPVSDLSELYHQFSEYRVEIIEERVRQQLKDIRDARRAKNKINLKSLKGWLTEQIEFLEHTRGELVDERDVTKGHVGSAFPVSAIKKT